MKLENVFNQDGYLWSRGHDLGSANLPNHSDRTPDVPAHILTLCQRVVTRVLPEAFPVKSTLFAKSEERSWALGWHQDRVIPVADKQEREGFINWSRKDGVWHVEPPIEYLNQMVFAQVYLDPVGADDGPMEIAAGSHHHGKISARQKDQVLTRADAHKCLAEPGDILICKALTLHRSLASKSGRQRRILRIDFASSALPSPLKWARA